MAGGIDERAAQPYLEAAARFDVHLAGRHPYFYVDLDALRRDGSNHLSTLSRNTRHQTRRSMTRYAARGPLRLTLARTGDEALELFSRLRMLHQRTWQARGEPGAFAGEFANAFHEHLIATRFEHEVEVGSGGGYFYWPCRWPRS